MDSCGILVLVSAHSSNPRFVVPFVSRSAVLGCYITEQLFLENDGVFHLMDLLEVLSNSFFEDNS